MTVEPATGEGGPLALDTRRRRALWRATHRGTKELDLLIGRYAEAILPAMEPQDLDQFEEFLAVAETDLQRWLLSPGAIADDRFADTVRAVRRFHGLTTT